MTSSLRHLLTPGVKQPVTHDERLSLESAVLDAETLVIDDLTELLEAHREQDEVISEIKKNEQLYSGLDDLLSSTLDDYSTSGMSAEAAALFRLSVESVFKASGVNLDLSRVIVSFESDTGMSVMARSKNNVSAMMKQISEVIGSLMARLREIASTVIAKLRSSKTSVVGYIAAVDNKFKRISKSTPDKQEVTLGSIADYLVDRTDRIGKPDAQMATNADLYGDFIIEWENHWRELMGLSIPSSFRDDSASVAFAGRVEDLSKKLVTQPGLDIRFILSHHLIIDAGKGNNPLLGASLEISQSSKAKSDESVTLTVAEIKHGIDTAKLALRVLETAERKIDLMVSDSQRFSQSVRNIRVDAVNETEGAKLRESLRALGKASTLVSDGYLNTLPVYLRALKANVRYIDLSVSEYL